MGFSPYGSVPPAPALNFGRTFQEMIALEQEMVTKGLNPKSEKELLAFLQESSFMGSRGISVVKNLGLSIVMAFPQNRWFMMENPNVNPGWCPQIQGLPMNFPFNQFWEARRLLLRCWTLYTDKHR